MFSNLKYRCFLTSAAGKAGMPSYTIFTCGKKTDRIPQAPMLLLTYYTCFAGFCFKSWVIVLTFGEKCFTFTTFNYIMLSCELLSVRFCHGKVGYKFYKHKILKRHCYKNLHVKKNLSFLM